VEEGATFIAGQTQTAHFQGFWCPTKPRI